MNIANYLDSTYLKMPEQAGISQEETREAVFRLVDEAMEHHFCLVMIRPEFVKEVKNYLNEKKSEVIVGTVIGFHEGTYTTEEKLSEAEKAIEDGVDELDYVINFEAFKYGKIDEVKQEFIKGTELGLQNGKVVKWIIEIAALNDEQIAGLTRLISETAQSHFEEKDLEHIFVKSSTGFYKTEGGKPNGATFEGIKIMLDNAGKLSVKAAGGVKTPADAEKMIKMGVKRIGTSSALALVKGNDVEGY